MGSLFGDWPSYDPHNFSKLRPADPSTPSQCHGNDKSFVATNLVQQMTPATYRPTHSRTLPPPDQVITTETKNILLRHMYQNDEEKLRQKRAASEHLLPEHGSKQLRASVADNAKQA